MNGMLKAGLATVVVAAALILTNGKAVHADDGDSGGFSCTTASCPAGSGCNGDWFQQSGTCAISCFVNGPNPGQITPNGGAVCGKGLDDDN